MNVFNIIQSKTIDELAEWLNEYCMFDNSPWIQWWDSNYCNSNKCETEIVRVLETDEEMECSWCELHNKCKFFQELNDIPGGKEIIKMWLESDG